MIGIFCKLNALKVGLGTEILSMARFGLAERALWVPLGGLLQLNLP